MRGRASISLAVVLGALASTMVLGLAQKAPCASGDWGDLRQYRMLCYSDLVPLYSTEQLQGDRLPFIDHCEGTCDEYPVLTMYTMRLVAWPVDSFFWFFYGNALVLAIAAGLAAFALYRAVGGRALYFALAPTLLIYGFVNWDLLPVALTAGATLQLVRRRDGWAGILLGLGAAAKLYPAFLLVPFAAERLRTKEPDRAGRLVFGAVAAWAVVNAPFVLTDTWSTFFRFNQHRPADWDSLWFISCNPFGAAGCGNTNVVNLFSVIAFVAVSAVVWAVKVRRDPDMPRWKLGFPILVAFLLTNKVYSPQYGLWLLPWFALALPDLRFFAAFEAADIAVFVTRFAYFGHLSGGENGWTDAFTIGLFQVALLVRAAVLVACVVRFVLGTSRERVQRTSPAPEPAPA
ncbi:MAG: glycosyltransferase 87 family protein [Actinomycetota bacterium]